LFTRRKEGSITQGVLPRCAQREQGLGYCSVALHLAFICRHNVQERAPRTGRLSGEGVSGVGGTGDILECVSQLLTARTAGEVSGECQSEMPRTIEMPRTGDEARRTVAEGDAAVAEV